MSTADQLLNAKLAAVATRYAVRGQIDDLEAAVAELREIAGDRPDLLAELAGVALGLAEEGPPLLAPRFRAEAELARAAGADESLIAQWIEVGKRRAEAMKNAPYTGSAKPSPQSATDLHGPCPPVRLPHAAALRATV